MKWQSQNKKYKKVVKNAIATLLRSLSFEICIYCAPNRIPVLNKKVSKTKIENALETYIQGDSRCHVEEKALNVEALCSSTSECDFIWS